MDGVAELSELDGYVELWERGAFARGEFHCSGCGYGIAIAAVLPACPMCGGEAWERVERARRSRPALLR
jgi:predicted RNA-binding Zn-ribbon protein involved in translation (DUF1610 family)